MSANLIDRFRQDPRFRWEMIVLGCMYIGYAALYMCLAQDKKLKGEGFLQGFDS